MVKKISILAIIVVAVVAAPVVALKVRQAAAARALAGVQGTHVESTPRGWIIVLGPAATDLDLSPVANIGEIDQLVLRGFITDEGIAAVAKNPRIRTLSLQGVRNPLLTNDAGAAVARITYLQEIYFRHMQLGDGFLSHLVTMPHLRTVDGGGSLVTDAGAQLLSKRAASRPYACQQELFP